MSYSRCIAASSAGASVSAINYNYKVGSYKKPVEEYTEYDDRVRTAKVHLFIRDCEGYEISIAGEELKHWTLLLNFSKGKWCSAEGQSVNGEMKAMYSPTRPDNGKMGKQQYLGATTISPKKFRELVMMNKLNGTTYFLATNNCQDWVIELAKQLGQNIQNAMNQFNTVKKINPLLAFGFSFMSAAVHAISEAMDEAAVRRNQN